jgi:hypothetical protein
VALTLVAVLAATGPDAPRAEECLTIEDFARAKVGQFPAGWTPRKDAGRDAYTVLEEAGVRFLRAVSKGLGIQAARAYAWDLEAYPILAWSWRPRQFPAGSDERASGTNDSVLAVYLLVPYSRVVGPKAVKYVWSERVPVGTHLTSNHDLTQVRVLRSGPPSAAGWMEERVDVLADYRRYFRETTAPKPAGIAVLTDADDTGSVASGDYANFRACRG